MIATFREVCKHIERSFLAARVRPSCIETGCAYVTVSPDDVVHTTTNNIVDLCRNTGGFLHSFDIDPEHVGFATGLCGEGAPVEFVIGDSVEELTRYAGGALKVAVDLLCLDSKEFDEGHMVREFKAIESRLRRDHWVLVDDIHNPNSVKYKKMVPLLKELGYAWCEVATPTGLFVAAKGYGLPK